jgi:hypothetical protein
MVGFGFWCAVVDSSSAKELGYVTILLMTQGQRLIISSHIFLFLHN